MTARGLHGIMDSMFRSALIVTIASTVLACSSAAQEAAPGFPPDPDQFEPFPQSEPPPEFQPPPDGVPPPNFGTPPNFAPPFPPPLQQPPPECDLLASPDYVPGIGVRGREVVPADVPGQD